jgi:hypothetical protein
MAGVVKPGAAASERVRGNQVSAAEHAERVLGALGGDRGPYHLGHGRVAHGHETYTWPW